MANLVDLWDRLQIVGKKADRDDPWRAQRIRARAAATIAVILILGGVITLIVLMTAGLRTEGGSDAVGATANPVTRCAPGIRGRVDTRFDGLRYEAAWRKARTLGVQIDVVAYDGKCDLTSPALVDDQPIVTAEMTNGKIAFAVS